MNNYRDLKRYVFAPGILEIYTNSPKLYDFKFGIPWLCERQLSFFSAPCQVSLEWREIKDVRVYLKDYRNKKIPYIFQERPLAFGKRVQVLLRWGTSHSPTVQLLTNKEYFKWASRRLALRFTSGSYCPLPGTILSNVACAALLEAGYAPVHCACAELNGIGVLLIAPSDTGKTSTIQKLVQFYGFRFVAEDIAITNGQEIVGCPCTGTGIPSQKSSSGFLRRLRLMLSYFSPKGPLRFRESLTSILAPSSILSKTTVDYIIFLKQGKDRIVNVDKQDITHLLFKLNRLEFQYLTDPFLLQLWYQYDVPNMEQVFEQERRLLTALVHQAKETISISAENANGFASQINSLIKDAKKNN